MVGRFGSPDEHHPAGSHRPARMNPWHPHDVFHTDGITVNGSAWTIVHTAFGSVENPAACGHANITRPPSGYDPSR